MRWFILLLQVLSIPQNPTFLVSRIFCNVGFSEVTNLTLSDEGKEPSDLLTFFLYIRPPLPMLMSLVFGM